MSKKTKVDEKGFIPMLVTLLLIVLVVIGYAFYRVVSKK
jgi:hypothetical protein